MQSFSSAFNRAMGEKLAKAIVLGASMSGLLAARTLADFYQNVIVVDRDQLPDGPFDRRGVPQGKHPHSLSVKGAQILEERFPGLFDHLVADGAVRWDDGDLSKLSLTLAGHRVVRSGRVPDPASVTTYYLSRPMLESGVRRRVREIPNVAFLELHDFVGLTSDHDRSRLTGVRVVNRSDRCEVQLDADLVVDATGRGSRLPVLMEELGYRGPRVDDVEVRIAYATLPVRIPRGALREHVITVFPVPGRSTMLAILACENDTYMVLGGTVGGDDPPTDRAELLDFIAELAPRHVMTALRSAEPLGDVAQYRIPSNRWRRYDKLVRVPQGLLALGDAICSFNPIYGQGITVAAIEAEVLRECLIRGDHDVPQRFYRDSAKRIKWAWRSAVGSDLALPQVPGRRPLSLRLMNAWLDRVLSATETDQVVTQQFFRVIWMLDSAATLLRPAIVLRTARALIARRRGRAGGVKP